MSVFSRIVSHSHCFRLRLTSAWPHRTESDIWKSWYATVTRRWTRTVRRTRAELTILGTTPWNADKVNDCVACRKSRSWTTRWFWTFSLLSGLVFHRLSQESVEQLSYHSYVQFCRAVTIVYQKNYIFTPTARWLNVTFMTKRGANSIKQSTPTGLFFGIHDSRTHYVLNVCIFSYKL